VVATIPTVKVKVSDDRALELFPAIEGNTTLVNSSLLRSVPKSAYGILNNKVITSDLMQLSNHQLNSWSKFHILSILVVAFLVALASSSLPLVFAS
jgi:hypothetical protein